ncbi:MAG: efflux RND transporter permease subunit [Gemmatimonadaceae bacterium]
MDQDVVDGFGSVALDHADAGQVIQGRERYGVLVRYPRDFRDDPQQIAQILVATSSGAEVPLGALARIGVVPGSTLIKSENGYLENLVYVDVRNRNIGSYVTDAKKLLDQKLVLPTGYRIEWSGQYESLQRATARLRIVVPLTLLIIFGLLYFNFRSVGETLIVMLSLPFALVGGVWLMWILGYNLSVAVAIGSIALSGVAAETGVIMLIYLDHAYRDRVRTEQMHSISDLHAGIEYGAVERVRPKITTVVAIIAGLLPLLWSQDVGADLTKRIAAPMVGGMITSAALTLIVIPAIYSLWREWQLDRGVSVASAKPGLVRPAGATRTG